MTIMQLLTRSPFKISIGLGGVALIVLAVIMLSPSPAPAQPVISWVPESVIENVTPGESKMISVTFTSLEDMTDVSVRVVPELEPFVRTEPTAFSALVAGQATNLSVIVSADANPAFGVYDGTIQLRTNKGLARLLPVDITVSVLPVPPDPGEAGKATLEGIDSDDDGVRDDIERYIVLTYPESERTRAALSQSARSIQESLPNAEDEAASITIGHERARAMECLIYVHGPEQTIGIFGELRAQLLNTDERSLAYIKASEHLSGEDFPRLPANERVNFCNFNPETLEN